ncbi:MAG: tRNA pseudouridine(38-40) synthase TruA [Pseudomonadota bacterium]
MPRFRLTIEYHGAPFLGWQRQAQGPSVQGRLETALAALDTAPDGSAPLVQGAGRTDTGVHATGQVAHVDLARDWDPFRLTEAVNHHLKPAPVAVIAAARTADGFHARFSAVARHYRYRIVNRRAPLALERGLAWRIAKPLDAAAMAEGAAQVLGRHDFTTFRSAQCQAASPIKTLDVFTVERQGAEILCTLSARSFLHNQVRSLVGSLERVGAGAWPPARMGAALAAADRAACGPVAPPDGLVLTQVDYPDDV